MIYVDLKFQDGTVTKQATASTTYTLDIWVRVLGTNASIEEGLGVVNMAFKTAQADGGIVAGGTGLGIQGISLSSKWYKASPLIGKLGAVYNNIYDGIPSDSLQDWGDPNSSLNCVSISSAAGNATSGWYPSTIGDGSATQYDGYAAFKVGTLSFKTGSTINAGADGRYTRITPIRAGWQSTNPKYYQAYPDGVLDYAYGGTNPFNVASFGVNGVTLTGSTANDTKVLIVSADTSSETTGVSAKTLSLGNVLKGASIDTWAVSLGKTGADAGTYTVTVGSTGLISSTLASGNLTAGTQTINGNITVNTASYRGAASDTVVINNTTLNATDGADTFTVSVGAVGQATASITSTDIMAFNVANKLTAAVAGSGGTYVGLSAKTSASQGNGVLGTEAQILYGGNTGAAKTVSMNWRTRAAAESSATQQFPLGKDGSYLVSDVVDVDGMAKAGGLTSAGGTSHETDVFVLQMSYDWENMTDEAVRIATGNMMLMYLDEEFLDLDTNTVKPLWRPAYKGNFGIDQVVLDDNAANGNHRGWQYMGDVAFDPQIHAHLGMYGVDTQSNPGQHMVWAVLNHNSQFAVPEPMTVSLLVIGGVGMMLRRRRRSRA